jgi:hypothetical protein
MIVLRYRIILPRAFAYRYQLSARLCPCLPNSERGIGPGRIECLVSTCNTPPGRACAPVLSSPWPCCVFGSFSLTNAVRLDSRAGKGRRPHQKPSANRDCRSGHHRCRVSCPRLTLAFHQAAIGHEVLHPWETLDVMDFIQNDQ